MYRVWLYLFVVLLMLCYARPCMFSLLCACPYAWTNLKKGFSEPEGEVCGGFKCGGTERLLVTSPCSFVAPVIMGSSTTTTVTCHKVPKIKKILYDLTEADDFMREEVATYEEVAKLYPRPGLYRPLALVGPPGVGRNELKRRLIATDSNKYRSPVPCEFLWFLSPRTRIFKL